MRFASLRVLALASLASLAMATSSSAVTILQFAQTNPNDFVTATVVGSTTTLTTNSALVAGSIPIQITNLAGVPLGVPLAALETFVNVTSTGPATLAGGTIDQPFSGTINITSLTGTNVLTTVFAGATLSGLAGGGSAALIGSRPPGSVTFTSDIPAIQALITDSLSDNFAISFSGIDTPPGLSLSGSTIAGFTARNAGTFDTIPIPEPSGIVMAGTAMLASLGCIGWRRRQSSQA